MKPLDGDYDIDVGVFFEVNIHKFSPLDVKKWVYDAVWFHTKDVRWRRPCVTAFYYREGEPAYHVDLAIYAKDRKGQTRIAMGKQHSDAKHSGWEISDPRELTKLVGSRFDGGGGAQFRRVVRYLKRWKDLNFKKQGNSAPTGIALTAAAYEWFSPETTGFWSPEPDDLGALRSLTDSMLSRFSDGRGRGTSRLEVRLPTAPQNDLFEWMTDHQMLDFKHRLETLGQSLEKAASSGSDDPVQACRVLRSVLGADFPS